MRLAVSGSIALLTSLVVLSSSPQGQAPVTPLRMPLGTERWTPLAGQPGVEEAILDGDPTAPGFYTLRRRYPGGYYGPPHYHPHIEYAIVITGTVQVAVGDSLASTAATSLPPGSFIRIPAFTAHALWTQGEVILQIYGSGPRRTMSGLPPR